MAKNKKRFGILYVTITIDYNKLRRLGDSEVDTANPRVSSLILSLLNLIEKHQKRIDNIELLYKNFYEQLKTETIGINQADKMFVVGEDDVIFIEFQKHQ